MCAEERASAAGKMLVLLLSPNQGAPDFVPIMVLPETGVAQLLTMRG